MLSSCILLSIIWIDLMAVVTTTSSLICGHFCLWLDIKCDLSAGEECKSGDNDGRLHSLPSEHSWYYLLYPVFMVSFICLNVL